MQTQFANGSPEPCYFVILKTVLIFFVDEHKLIIATLLQFHMVLTFRQRRWIKRTYTSLVINKKFGGISYNINIRDSGNVIPCSNKFITTLKHSIKLKTVLKNLNNLTWKKLCILRKNQHDVDFRNESTGRRHSFRP